MVLSINLDPQEAERLAEVARQSGLTPEAFARQLIKKSLPPGSKAHHPQGDFEARPIADLSPDHIILVSGPINKMARLTGKQSTHVAKGMFPELANVTDEDIESAEYHAEKSGWPLPGK